MSVWWELGEEIVAAPVVTVTPTGFAMTGKVASASRTPGVTAPVQRIAEDDFKTARE
jgi:hypothetical protein